MAGRYLEKTNRVCVAGCGDARFWIVFASSCLVFAGAASASSEVLAGSIVVQFRKAGGTQTLASSAAAPGALPYRVYAGDRIIFKLMLLPAKVEGSVKVKCHKDKRFVLKIGEDVEHPLTKVLVDLGALPFEFTPHGEKSGTPIQGLPSKLHSDMVVRVARDGFISAGSIDVSKAHQAILDKGDKKLCSKDFEFDTRESVTDPTDKGFDVQFNVCRSGGSNSAPPECTK